MKDVLHYANENSNWKCALHLAWDRSFDIKGLIFLVAATCIVWVGLWSLNFLMEFMKAWE